MTTKERENRQRAIGSSHAIKRALSGIVEELEDLADSLDGTPRGWQASHAKRALDGAFESVYQLAEDLTHEDENRG